MTMRRRTWQDLAILAATAAVAMAAWTTAGPWSVAGLAAQAPSNQSPSSVTPGANVDVTATPKVVLAGQTVTIAGSTGYSQKQHQATVVIRHESGAPSATLEAAVSPNRQFSLTFSDTKKSGRYKVTVTSPDGKGKGDAEFRVDSIADLAQDVERLSAELDKRTKALTTFVRNTTTSLPASPERDQLIGKVQQLDAKARTVDLPPVKILGQLKALALQPRVVNLPDLTVLGELRDWVPRAEDGIEIIDRSRIGEKPAPLCETINTAIEGAKLAAYAFTITESLLGTLLKVGVDKGVPALVEGLGYEGPAALASSSAIKASAEALHGVHEVAKVCPAAATDIAEYAAKWMFGRYCGSFEGPLHVAMAMTWNEGPLPWLKYGVRLEGQFRLRYPKTSPAGQPVYMTGELEGNATNFSFWQDVTVAEPLPKGVMVLEQLWLPPVPFKASTSSPVDFGMVARALTPAYFNVPVVGEMTGDTVKMQFKEARVDFTGIVRNRLLFVVLTPLMPDFKVFTFPIQKAQWILAKGFSDPCILTVTESPEGAAIKFTTKTHRESADKSVVADWTINVDARKAGEEHEK